MKQYHRYRMDFTGKWVQAGACFMGLSVFTLAVYYFGICNLSDLGIAQLVLGLWVPLILGAVYILLLRFIHWDAPGIYAIAGVVFCLLYVVGLFSGGGILRIILGLVGYGFGAVILVAVVGGYLPDKLIGTVYFLILILVRVLCFDVGKLSAMEWITECSTLCSMAALMCLPMSLRSGKKR